MPADHWMTFGTFAEQRYFTYPDVNTYKGVIINANMLAHAPSGLAAFVAGKTRPDFPFIIDPLTHAFQQDISFIANKKGDDVKSSIKNLAGDYGEFINRIVGSRPVTPEDFSDDILEEFTISCLEFQKNKLVEAIKDSDYYKYLEELGEEINKPYSLIAPYFFIEEFTADNWLPIIRNASIVAINSEKESGNKIFACIVVDQGVLLNQDIVDTIIEAFHDIELHGFLVWVDELDETNTNSSVLNGFLRLCRGLRDGGNKEVINLHGGYFSLLASTNVFGDSALSGVAHGPEFGEFRKIVPVGGGIPVAKFYIKQLHSRVNYKKAVSYYRSLGWLNSSDTYYSNICDCESCHEVIGNDTDNFTRYGLSETKLVRRGGNMVSMEYAIKETKDLCLKHYLQKKNEEYTFVANSNKRELLKDLELGIKNIERVSSHATVSHLRLWHNVLS